MTFDLDSFSFGFGCLFTFFFMSLFDSFVIARMLFILKAFEKKFLKKDDSKK